jgi:hypothetical protein
MDSIDNSTSALLKALLVSSVVYLAPINYYDFGSHVWGSVLLSPNLNDTFGVAVWVSYIALTIVLQALLVISLYSLFRLITWRFFTSIVVIVSVCHNRITAKRGCGLAGRPLRAVDLPASRR